MSLKFGKHNSVTSSYFAIPLYHTGIMHPHNKNKELVLMDRFGKYYSACWRNNERNSIGIVFLVRAVANGFIYKDKEFNLKNMNKVW